jgi:hypothetical protein
MNVRFVTLCVLFVSLLIGCGSSEVVAPAPTLVLTKDGKPLAGILVQLATDDGKGVASGTTDPLGNAVVRGGDGKPPAKGKYKLVLADAGEEEANPMEPAKNTNRNRVPKIYGKAATTTASVTLDGTLGPFPVEIK